MPSAAVRIAGLLLAAGGGSRYGLPKALADTDGELWVQRSITALQTGGCAPVVVVLGARADEALRLLPADVVPVVNSSWESGVSSSLRAGLLALTDSPASGVLVTLVDLPGVTASTVSRMLAHPGAGAPDALLQADFEGEPGHPVVLGRAHWPRLLEVLSGDSGARDYLAAHGAIRVPLGSASEGADVDVEPR
jgi:CTP:molybdopterin cytidylyltransferase MocA